MNWPQASLQLRQGILYPRHGFTDVLVACGITHAEALRVTECITRHGGNMADLKQVQREVCRIVDFPFPVAQAKELAAGIF